MTKRRLVHPENDMVYVCPECDLNPVRERVDQARVHYDRDKRCICEKCKATFDEPVERKTKSPVTDSEAIRRAKNGLASKLEEMDPEDVTA